MTFIKIKRHVFDIWDLEKAKNFYHHTLGLPVIDYVNNKHLFLWVGNSVLLCFNPDDSKNKVSPPGHFGGGKQHVAFELGRDDYAVSKEEIFSKNIPITDEITWPGGKKIFLL